MLASFIVSVSAIALAAKIADACGILIKTAGQFDRALDSDLERSKIRGTNGESTSPIS
jgi:hypothetical protein